MSELLSCHNMIDTFLCAWCWRRCPIDRLAQRIGPKRRPRCAACQARIKEPIKAR